jgi:ribosomal protein S18 acetylase RimI-like enzyme
MADWYDPDATRELVRREDVAYFVAERGGEVVGYVSGGPSDDGDVALLGAIYVDPEHWGCGAGSALLDAFEGFCRREGYDSIVLRVLAENEVGTSFYEARGYTTVEERETELFGESTRERVYSSAVGNGSNSA